MQIRNQIATALLPHGVNVATLPQLTEGILKHFGRARLQQALKAVSPDRQEEEIVKMANQAGYHVKIAPVGNPRIAASNKKYKVEDIKNELSTIDIAGVQIEPGFFVTPEGNDMQQIASLVPKKSGIVLAKEIQIRSWLQDSKAISPDPLAAFVIGRQTPQTTLPTAPINLPARDAQGRPILLAGHLVQFGQTQVVFTPKKEDRQTDPQTKIVAITAWKDEMSNEHWLEVMRTPSKSLQSFLKIQESEIHLHATWGISYQHQGKTCNKYEAESIQMHATIDESCLPTILRLSGFHGLYCTPKSQDGIHTDDWKIIWLPIQVQQTGSQAEVMRQIAKLEEPYGIIRSKTNFGIRVKAEDFGKCFALLRPEDPIPNSILGRQVFKLTPFPFGCTPQVLQDWLKTAQWNASVIRPLGPQTWLFAAEREPNSTFLTFNGTPLLVRQLPPKGEKPKPAVVAGPRLPKISEPKDHDQLFEQDPWASYKGAQQAANFVSHTSSQPAASSGVMQTKLQQQDDKITVMMEEVNKMKISQKKLEEGIDTKINQVSETIEQQKHSFAHQLKQMKADLETSFQQAVSVQNNNITAGFQDIKRMFQQANDRAPAVRRTHEAMNEDEDSSM